MTAYNFGDVVLVGFPHTDLQGISKKPAFVIYDAGDLDILVARVTTHIPLGLIIKSLSGNGAVLLPNHSSGSANRQRSKRNI